MRPGQKLQRVRPQEQLSSMIEGHRLRLGTVNRLLVKGLPSFRRDRSILEMPVEWNEHQGQ